ncbi:hypothetical protein [Paraburkholderia tropica]|uniref:hypothetical protein n=1 Tax=Paraburkholderia tropica TaxID=92647 RepID=UPI003D2D7961
MAYREVEDLELIGQYDKQLRSALTKKGKFYEKRTIGYPSGYTTRFVNFLGSDANSIWYCSWEADDGSVVNLFGRGEFGSTKTLLIDLQFNYGLDRVYKNLGGAFLQDTTTGEISLAHRGIITVRHRIPIEVVFEVMAGHSVEAQSGRAATEFLLITELKSPNLLRDIGEFAIELRDSVRAKVEAATTVSIQPDGQSTKHKKSGFDQLKDYSEEFTGQRKSFKPKRIYAKSNHGKVVQALNKEFLGNGNVYKSRAVDLVVEQKSRALLFEVKTSSDTQSIYTAIGQLFIHVFPAKEKLNKPVVQVLVVPEQPMEHVAAVISNELKFQIVTYSIDEQGVVSFDNLEFL